MFDSSHSSFMITPRLRLLRIFKLRKTCYCSRFLSNFHQTRLQSVPQWLKQSITSFSIWNYTSGNFIGPYDPWWAVSCLYMWNQTVISDHQKTQINCLFFLSSNVLVLFYITDCYYLDVCDFNYWDRSSVITTCTFPLSPSFWSWPAPTCLQPEWHRVTYKYKHYGDKTMLYM